MALAQFAREYRIVRAAEGWGSHERAYYAGLPYRDRTGRHAWIWRIRARSYDTFVAKVLVSLERQHGRLSVLDLGAGNGWLSHRLAQRGHSVLAIDVLDDPLDGLGAIKRYAHTVLPLVADFDCLPLPPECADVAIFNAALHYSTSYAATLRESLRVLRPRGTLVILDSPMYTHPTSGRRMVHERQARFLARYGFASTALPSEHFLTPDRLNELAASSGITWTIHQPRLDYRTRLSRMLGGIRAGRQPATFPVINGTRA